MFGTCKVARNYFVLSYPGNIYLGKNANKCTIESMNSTWMQLQWCFTVTAYLPCHYRLLAMSTTISLNCIIRKPCVQVWCLRPGGNNSRLKYKSESNQLWSNYWVQCPTWMPSHSSAHKLLDFAPGSLESFPHQRWKSQQQSHLEDPIQSRKSKPLGQACSACTIRELYTWSGNLACQRSIANFKVQHYIQYYQKPGWVMSLLSIVQILLVWSKKDWPFWTVQLNLDWEVLYYPRNLPASWISPERLLAPRHACHCFPQSCVACTTQKDAHRMILFSSIVDAGLHRDPVAEVGLLGHHPVPPGYHPKLRSDTMGVHLDTALYSCRSWNGNKNSLTMRML